MYLTTWLFSWQMPDPILVINKILGCLQYSAKHVFHLFYYARIAKLFLNLEILPYSYVQKYFWYSRILVRALIKIWYSACNKSNLYTYIGYITKESGKRWMSKEKTCIPTLTKNIFQFSWIKHHFKRTFLFLFLQIPCIQPWNLW